MRKLLPRLTVFLLLFAMLLSAVPGATAARPEDLRRVTANQALAIAGVNWKLGSRISRADHADEAKQAMYDAGVQPTAYYELARMNMPYRGVMVENRNGSLEQFKAQINDEGTITKRQYYGMNADSFLTDVLSRVMPDKITGVKQAAASGALTALQSGVNASAASSKAATGASFTEMSQAYSKLAEGDVLLAWDDAADPEKAPKVHAMIVTEVDAVNRGTVTVTYPAYEQPVYRFVCAECGFESLVGPTPNPDSQHITSKNYVFSAFKTHSATYPESSCSGKWTAAYGSTWRTETVSFEQLFGEGDKSVPYGGTRYLPYTLPVYATGETAAADVKVTSDANANNLASGFKAQITSNYRIVQVDAVLSQLGQPDRVFTNYTDWDAWSCDFQNAELDKALFESTTGKYMLSLNVYTGAITDPDTMERPKVKAYTLDMALEDPSFELTGESRRISQGADTVINVKTMTDGITGADLTVSFDKATYVFNLDATKKANPECTFALNADGTASVKYFGKPLAARMTMAFLHFTVKHQGAAPVAAADSKPFNITTALVSNKSGATAADLIAARVGGTPPRVNLGWDVVIYPNYAPGGELLLVFRDVTPAKLTYDGTDMIDVSDANYAVDGKHYPHTYAFIAPKIDPDKIDGKTHASTAKSVFTGQLFYDGDVNRSGSLDVKDLQLILNIYSGKHPLEGNMKSWLLADTDRNGKLDVNDIKALAAKMK